MILESDGGGAGSSLQSSVRQLERGSVTMDLTRCGLLVDRAVELARLYAEHGNWNDVKDRWFEERLGKRSTRGSSQGIYRILSSRFKNAPTTLPNPSSLPSVIEHCQTSRDIAQILYLYLVAEDSLVQYAVQIYIERLQEEERDPLDFSNDTITKIFAGIEYSDGSSFQYAESTIERWCEGFRSVMREIGVLDAGQSTVGTPPPIGDIPLLVSMGYSYGTGEDEWINAPRGLCYLFQPEHRWEELFDRAVRTDVWTYRELPGTLEMLPADEPYSWIHAGGVT